tara:strand:+ start:744 stop:1595 length:852 start_codon:yes stop_codon:yes gene_type:complete
MEEFDVLKDFYFPIQEQEKLYSSNAYQNLKNNNIDTAELEGDEPDKDAGEIVFDVDKQISEGENDIFLKDILDFTFKDLPRDTLITVIRGGTNALQFVNNLTAAVGINPDDTNISINKKLNKMKTDLDKADKDSPLVSKLLAVVAQDAAYTYPIYKKLKSAGIPQSYRMPLAFGLGGALAFDKDKSLFVDSASMRGLKNYIGVAPDTPIEEMFDKGVQALEFGAFGKFFDTIINGVKVIKNIPPEQVKQTALSLGGASAITAVVDKVSDNQQNNIISKVTENK